MAVWKTIGDYLSNSGWTAALTQAGIASSGTADFFLRCCHLTRTRRAHQVSAVTLAKLQEDAFLSTGKPDTEDAKETWRQDMISRSPTFQFWDTILHFELPGLVFSMILWPFPLDVLCQGIKWSIHGQGGNLPRVEELCGLSIDIHAVLDHRICGSLLRKKWQELCQSCLFVNFHLYVDSMKALVP